MALEEISSRRIGISKAIIKTNYASERRTNHIKLKPNFAFQNENNIQKWRVELRTHSDQESTSNPTGWQMLPYRTTSTDYAALRAVLHDEIF
jgi:hypothetical protein